MASSRANLSTFYACAVAALAPLPRAVFLMNRVDDLSYCEIGRRLGLDVATVEASMIDALGKVARHVDAQITARRGMMERVLSPTKLAIRRLDG